MKTLHEILTEAGALLHFSSAGAGARLLAEVWDQPGASRYLVGAIAPYARTDLRAFLGFAPEGSVVCPEVALEMAMASYVRAAEEKVAEGLAGEPIGLGLTAAVASERLPRGEQRAFAAVVSARSVRSLSIPLVKSTGSVARREHDALIADAVIGFLARAAAGEEPGLDAAGEATELCFRHPVFEPDGTRSFATAAGLYLPATLNPLHEGHRAMLNAGELVSGIARGSYLVTATSVHKPALSIQEMLLRVGMVRAERWQGRSRAVEFSRNDPLFVDKARQRPGSTFIIGADTMRRMLDPQWGPPPEDVLTALAEQRASFLVMGRDVDGEFLACQQIPVPSPFRALFRPLEGRFEISSTSLREARAQQT